MAHIVDELNRIVLCIVAAIIIFFLLVSMAVIGSLRPDALIASCIIIPIGIILVFTLSVFLGFFGLFLAIAIILMLVVSQR
jgi:hypothetical protein